jgi:integrase
MSKKKPISEKSDKRRRAKVVVAHRADGSPVIKYASGRTKKELEQSKAELLRRYTEGIEDVRENVLFSEYVVEWYETYKRPHIGKGSQKVYKSVINKHILPAFEDRPLRSIKPSELQRILTGVSDMGRSTVGYIHSVITNVFLRATVERIITYNPALALSAMHAPGESKRALTDEEESAVLTVAETHPEGLLLHVLYYTGARRGEALGLKWSDIDFSERLIHIRRDIDYAANSEGSLKTYSSIRTVPIPDGLYTALSAVRGIGDAYVFPAPETPTAFLCESTYRRRWARLQIALLDAEPGIESAELPASIAQRKRVEAANEKLNGKPPRKVPLPRYGSILTAHYFRHHFASLCYDADVDVKTAHKWLGHKDFKTTLTIYTHLSQRKEDNSTAQLNDVFSKKVAKRLPAK